MHPKTQTGCEWKGEKRYSVQRVTKKNRGGCANIRQNGVYIKKVTRDKGGHYTHVLIKHLVQQEDKTIIIIYTPNDRPAKFLKQKLIQLKGEIGIHTIVENFNILPSIINRKTRQNLSKGIQSSALVRLLSWVECCPLWQKAVGSIPGWGGIGKQLMNVSPPLPPSINISWGKN